MSTDRNRRIARNVSAWFREHARELPWRTTPRDPYHALVSELMLQQTQVSRVIERFNAFIGSFPTIHHLARAPEEDVLALWSGLGYYRRAKLLRRAAIHAVEHHRGELPREVRALESFPGVGRYTAGAIASIAHGEAAPIVDGNVARVLLRVDGVESAPDEPAARGYLWERAESLVRASDDPASFNEGLMELGATICTKSNPRCDRCPLKRSCHARRTGTIERIPAPKKPPTKRTLHIAMAVVRDERGRILIERRGGGGLWSGLWQGPSVESADRRPVRSALEAYLGLGSLRKDRELAHETTHRRVRFVTYRGTAEHRYEPQTGHFSAPTEIGRLPLSSPHRRLLLGE